MRLAELVYRGIRLSGWPAVRRRRRAAIFCFHNVVDKPTTEADSSLHMPVDRFERLADWLASVYRVLPLDELLGRVERGQPLGGLAAITADDGYRGFLRLGLPLLRRRGLPATLFVVSDAAEAPAPFWWDLAGANRRLDERTRVAALSTWGGQRDSVIGGLGLAELSLPADLLPADWATLAASLGAGLSIGSHTKTHPNLTSLARGETASEFSISGRAIAAHLGHQPMIASYPYGLFDSPVCSETKGAGYRYGLGLGSEPLTEGVDELAIPRINVPASVTEDKLECWATGLRWNKPK